MPGSEVADQVESSGVRVAIIMGSKSDLETMRAATTPLSELGVEFELKIVSANRTTARLFEFATQAHTRGIDVIIAGAGGAAHLAGMAAAMTHLPVIAVPVSSKQLKGMDSLLSMVQMPKGVAVACQAIGEAGAYNAGLMAAQILALKDTGLSQRLIAWRKAQTDSIPVDV